MTEPKGPLSRIVPFALVVTGGSFLVFLYLYWHRGPVIGIHGPRKELAEDFGLTGLAAMILIYGRSLLKLLLNEGALLQRLVPQERYEASRSRLRQALIWLNRSHRYVGAAAVAIFPCHALLMGTARWNPFLVLVLALIAWQGAFGFMLTLRFPPAQLKRYSYLVHAQLFTGVMIGVFAGFGHLLVP
ncbi:MAG: hypothetical protein M0T76_07240 [Desulfobacteraceae bacterium]|nr:hypothetical protein [Desulfobacteraceae bacterium]